MRALTLSYNITILSIFQYISVVDTLLQRCYLIVGLLLKIVLSHYTSYKIFRLNTAVFKCFFILLFILQTQIFTYFIEHLFYLYYIDFYYFVKSINGTFKKNYAQFTRICICEILTNFEQTVDKLLII